MLRTASWTAIKSFWVVRSAVSFSLRSIAYRTITAVRDSAMQSTSMISRLHGRPRYRVTPRVQNPATAGEQEVQFFIRLEAERRHTTLVGGWGPDRRKSRSGSKLKSHRDQSW